MIVASVFFNLITIVFGSEIALAGVIIVDFGEFIMLRYEILNLYFGIKFDLIYNLVIYQSYQCGVAIRNFTNYEFLAISCDFWMDRASGLKYAITVN